MKIIDHNGRLFGKISVIDVLVLAVAVFLGAALYLKTTAMPHTNIAQTSDTFTYTVLCRGIPDFVQGQIRVGDHLYDMDNLKVGSLGEIIDVQYLPGDQVTSFQDGTACLAPVEESFNILLTVRGSGMIVNGKYMINRIYPLGVNANRNLCTRYVSVRGIVSSIEK